RLAGKRRVGDLGIARWQRLGIVAALPGMLPLLRVAGHRPGGVVELQIAAAGVVEGADGVAIGRAEIVEELVEIGIDLAADRVAPLAEMQGRRRRDGHLRRDLAMRLEEAEVIEHRVRREAELALDLQALRLGLHAGELDAGRGLIRLDTVEAAEEVEVPPRAAELAVGRALQADVLLLLDDVLDLGVL